MLALRTIGDVAALGTATSAMSFLEFSDADVDSGRRTARGSHVETWNITRAIEALPELVSPAVQRRLRRSPRHSIPKSPPFHLHA